MGNTSGRDKMRHSSGEDSGPTMSPRDDYDNYSGSLDESYEFAPGSLRVGYLFIIMNCLTCNKGTYFAESIRCSYRDVHFQIIV